MKTVCSLLQERYGVAKSVRKVFFFSELSRHFGSQRVEGSLKLLATLPGRTM